MKLPQALDRIALLGGDWPLGPYPPLGFQPVSDATLGNGDYYGLYWPFGGENEEPVVCDMFHDEGSMRLAFSGLPKFIEWLEANDWERGDEEVEDPELASVLFFEAKKLLSGPDLDRAIDLLGKACQAFGEVSEFWFAYASQLRRVGKHEEAAHAALQSFNSNWVFGSPQQGTMRMLRSPKVIEVLGDDPVVLRLDELSVEFGGVKENPSCPVMLECAHSYLEAGRAVDGLLLLHNHGLMMELETGAFQRRYGFELESWQEDFSKKCQQHLGDSRRLKLEA